MPESLTAEGRNTNRSSLPLNISSAPIAEKVSAGLGRSAAQGDTPACLSSGWSHCLHIRVRIHLSSGRVDVETKGTAFEISFSSTFFRRPSVSEYQFWARRLCSASLQYWLPGISTCSPSSDCRWEICGQWVQLKRQRERKRGKERKKEVGITAAKGSWRPLSHHTLFGMKGDPPFLPKAAQKQECFWAWEGKGGRLPTLLSTLSLSSLSLVWFIFFLSFIPRPKSTRRPIDTRHSCAQVQSTSEQIKQWGDDRLLTVSEGWRQWAADNVFSLWRQFASRVAMVRVDSSVLCQNMPTGWMDVCVCVCACWHENEWESEKCVPQFPYCKISSCKNVPLFLTWSELCCNCDFSLYLF